MIGDVSISVFKTKMLISNFKYMKHNIKIYKTMIQSSMIFSTFAFYYECCKSGGKGREGVGWEATLNQGDSPLIPWHLSCMTWISRVSYKHEKKNHFIGPMVIHKYVAKFQELSFRFIEQLPPVEPLQSKGHSSRKRVWFESRDSAKEKKLSTYHSRKIWESYFLFMLNLWRVKL